MYRSHHARVAREAHRSVVHLAELQRGLAGPECMVGPALAQGNGEKLMLEKTKMPPTRLEKSPCCRRQETSPTAFQEVYIAVRVGVIDGKSQNLQVIVL